MNLSQLQLLLPSPIFTLDEAVRHCFNKGMDACVATAFCMEQGFIDVTARDIRMEYDLLKLENTSANSAHY